MEYREFIKKLVVPPGHTVPERLTYEDGVATDPMTVSRIRTATTSPEIAVSAATVTIAAENPAASAMVPATIAPTA